MTVHEEEREKNRTKNEEVKEKLGQGPRRVNPRAKSENQSRKSKNQI
jgi:hypothetical protein